jgi:hypothetical protein
MDARLRQASPIVVVGMHRSGTRLLVEILDRLGVFMGADRQADSESVVFMLVNEGILHQCGAFWSEPMSAHFVLAEIDAAQRLAAGVDHALAGEFAKYAGPSAWHLEARLKSLRAFGWKDPRNTFTLPVWRQVFPNLRVVNIVRHGVDVAASLARRHSAALHRATGEAVPSPLIVIRDQALGILSTRRGWTLAEALTMWEQYVEKARVESQDLGERALTVRFEDLVTSPGAVIPALAEFCRVPAPAWLGEPLDGLDASRAFAFRRAPELVAFADSVRAVLARYGYAP